MNNHRILARQLYRIARLLKILAAQETNGINELLSSSLGSLNQIKPMIKNIINKRKEQNEKERQRKENPNIMRDLMSFSWLNDMSFLDERVQKTLKLIPGIIDENIQGSISILEDVQKKLPGKSIEEIRKLIRGSSESPLYKLLIDIDTLYDTKELQKNAHVKSLIENHIKNIKYCLSKILGATSEQDLLSLLTTTNNNKFNDIIKTSQFRRIRNRHKLAAILFN